MGWFNERGQGATELMLIISVVVIGVSSAAYTFIPVFESGVQDLAEDVQRQLDTEPASISLDLLNHIAEEDDVARAIRELEKPESSQSEPWQFAKNESAVMRMMCRRGVLDC